MLSMIHFHLIFKYSFLTFKYSTVFISLLGTIYLNLIITFFYLRGSKHGAVFMFKLCIYYIFQEADNNKYPYKD